MHVERVITITTSNWISSLTFAKVQINDSSLRSKFIQCAIFENLKNLRSNCNYELSSTSIIQEIFFFPSISFLPLIKFLANKISRRGTYKATRMYSYDVSVNKFT